jgi:hypothetical protein
MSGYPDDDYERDDRDRDRDRDDRGRRDGRRIEESRQKVSTPAMLLIVASLIALLVEVGFLGLMVAKPTVFYDMMVDMIEKQPPGPEKQRQLNDLKQQEAQMRLDNPLNIGSAVLGLILNAVSVVGGFMMKKLSGYPLAISGAVCGVIPMGGCCCLTMPVGIWALVVLMNQDVKDAFAAGRVYDSNDRY